jgi:hypothetical protein
MQCVALCLALVAVALGAQPFPTQSPTSPRQEAQQDPGGKSPFSGTWAANVAKSQRHPNHLFQSATLRFAVASDTVTLTHGGVNASGEEESGAMTLQADGEEHPVSEQVPGVVVVTRWVGSRLLETVAKKDGTVVGQQSYEVSADGKTLTAKVWGTDAGGAHFEHVIAFDRK